jgi:hypothetical protein
LLAIVTRVGLRDPSNHDRRPLEGPHWTSFLVTARPLPARALRQTSFPRRPAPPCQGSGTRT